MRARTGLLTALLVLGFCRFGFAAEACDPLRPNPPRNMNEDIVGKIDTKVDGIAKRLLNLGATVEGTYKEASSDVLKEYPNADKLYLWDKTIYFYCITIWGSKLSDGDKLDRIEKLMDRIGKPPADQSGQGSERNLNNKESSSVTVAGVEVGINGMFLSTDKRTISANTYVKNISDDDVLVMAVGTESAFVIPNMLNKSPVLADGIANCIPHAGNAASTRLCSHDEDIRWTYLDKDRLYKTHLTSTLGLPITAAAADIRLRVLIKKNGAAKPYDIPFNNIVIK